jgi:hypothetical protein
MNRTTTTGLAALLLVAAYGLLVNPAAAQQTGSPPVNAVCSDDYICVDSTVVATWPLERWTQVRRQRQQAATTSRGTRITR